MAYNKTTWVNNDTELNADNLNKIEDGIEANANQIATNTSKIATNTTNITNAINELRGKQTVYNDLYLISLSDGNFVNKDFKNVCKEIITRIADNSEFIMKVQAPVHPNIWKAIQDQCKADKLDYINNNTDCCVFSLYKTTDNGNVPCKVTVMFNSKGEILEWIYDGNGGTPAISKGQSMLNLSKKITKNETNIASLSTNFNTVKTEFNNAKNRIPVYEVIDKDTPLGVWANAHTEAHGIVLPTALPSEIPINKGGFVTIRTVIDAENNVYKVVTYESFTTGDVYRRTIFGTRWNSDWVCYNYLPANNTSSSEVINTNGWIDLRNNFLKEDVTDADGTVTKVPYASSMNIRYCVVNNICYFTYDIMFPVRTTQKTMVNILNGLPVPYGKKEIYDNIISEFSSQGNKVTITADGQLQFRYLNVSTKKQYQSHTIVYPIDVAEWKKTHTS